jgi:hypothetical protein
MTARLLPAAAGLTAMVLMGASPAVARTAEIGFRPGGDVYRHIAEAIDMLKSGESYRVIGDQYSAAAMQVVYLERQMPGRICASPRARLHFHLGFDKEMGRAITKPDPVWVAFIGRRTLKRLGPLPAYGKGFKTVRASDYLGLCK